ncbi:MAG: prepilin-type N-terminal cleavage/methylation domain-containing protein [Veillonella sp.]|uniref:competence type IV pilus major pilin ComGC n=1 Tax=Veillonella sp. TaxID=1926307 RepID=UPI0028FE02C1|nr:prepilin-type N-terminal cleavage/methylation domain-containing protein [Veillonella sp.]MDU0852003.1 prepilin-type N-terminal cleavage/methylation domain-containing protein [Veillonella sp.]MDU0923953.1 prepilin-type N-terminal cleavage/methylation domain-containing protein [Veillonella sp.]MDU1500358.1 prepilin-type N-terminal cleavage/methylation domain-containing protein [Veillonella sp.]MDU1656099.1 prepilin-type N-terminal cleavage/methylation domain-containing protein [Veillonella sp.
MSSVMHLVHGLNHRLEICGQWIVERLHINNVRENLKKSRNGGFTLVELMVVVAVIAILAAIAMPQFLSAADRARTAKETADIQIIKNATQLYMIDKNVDTPPTVENLYKEGYLTEHVKTAKDKEYTITYEAVNGGTAKAVVVKAPDAP